MSHYYKRKSTKSRLDNNDTNTCWNCGKPEYHAKDYQAPNKKKEKIIKLELENHIINKLYSILDENHISF